MQNPIWALHTLIAWSITWRLTACLGETMTLGVTVSFWLATYLEDASQSRLLLTRHQVGSNSKRIYGVSLQKESIHSVAKSGPFNTEQPSVHFFFTGSILVVIWSRVSLLTKMDNNSVSCCWPAGFTGTDISPLRRIFCGSSRKTSFRQKHAHQGHKQLCVQWHACSRPQHEDNFCHFFSRFSLSSH